MMIKKYLQQTPITKNTLSQYFEEKYGKGYTSSLKKLRVIDGVKPLLQADYGLDGDCTVTSMTCVLEFLHHKPVQQIYDTVEQIDLKYGYNGNSYGTIPVFINSILKKVETKLGVKNTKWKSGYGKNLGYNFNTVVKCVDQRHPMILSLLNDGRGFYANHSITVVGYAHYIVNGRTQRFLIVQDNWNKEKCYVDYETLWAVSSLNYY